MLISKDFLRDCIFRFSPDILRDFKLGVLTGFFERLGRDLGGSFLRDFLMNLGLRFLTDFLGVLGSRFGKDNLNDV